MLHKFPEPSHNLCNRSEYSVYTVFGVGLSEVTKGMSRSTATKRKSTSKLQSSFTSSVPRRASDIDSPFTVHIYRYVGQRERGYQECSSFLLLAFVTAHQT